MKYQGGKRKHAKALLAIMLKHRQPEQFWVEPFVGGGGIFDKVGGNRIGADANSYTVEALKLIRDHSELLPANNSQISDEIYRHYKELSRSSHSKSKSGMIGYFGFALSFGGKWFAGMRRDRQGSRDYAAEAFRAARDQGIGLNGSKLISCAYNNLDIPSNSIIYCDPPYASTQGYITGAFDHAAFWQWCREKVAEGHTVFVSEYQAPSDWVCIWSKEVPNSLDVKSSKRAIERLFIHESQTQLYQ